MVFDREELLRENPTEECDSLNGFQLKEVMETLLCKAVDAQATKKMQDREDYDYRVLSYRTVKGSKLAQSLVSYSIPAPITFTESELTEAFANYLGLVSPIAHAYEGEKIRGHQDLKVDVYGHNIKSQTACSHDYIRIMHDGIVELLITEAKEGGIKVVGGYKNTCKNIFKQCFPGQVREMMENDPKRRKQGIIPDIVIDASAMVVTGTRWDNKITLCDVKTVASGKGYKELGPAEAVIERAEKVDREYRSKAKALDKLYYPNLGADQIGKFTGHLNSFGDRGRTEGLAFGAYGECSKQVNDLVDFIAIHKSRYQEDIAKGIFKKKIITKLGLYVHRSWAQILIGRVNTEVDGHKIDHNNNNNNNSVQQLNIDRQLESLFNNRTVG